MKKFDHILKNPNGIIPVTGPTGSGKSTTLAALINVIAAKYSKHIITLEDPIEYLHRHGKSVVVQREMWDLETISTAITAAETGHLVFSALHTNSAASTIDRVIDVFLPHQQQIRVQLANVIEGVIAQQLLPKQAS